MKWTYSVKNKMAVSTLLLSVMAVIFLNNLHERRNSVKISNTMASIYNDRLVVEGYIFQYSEYLHQIKEMLNNEDLNLEEKQYHIASLSAEIMVLNQAYRETRLTKEEAKNFENFSQQCKGIVSFLATGGLLKKQKIC